MALLVTPEFAEQSKNTNCTQVKILFKGNTIIVKKDKLIFQREISDLFNNNLIEHSFNCNDRIPDILKKLNKFNHYEHNQVLFIIYDLDFFAMTITIRIPFNLFELDLECCTDQEQIAYYKNKSLQLEQVIKLNDLVLAQYDIRFDKNSIFTVLSCSDLIDVANRPLLMKRHYSYQKLYFPQQRCFVEPFYSIYKELKKSSFIFNPDVVPVADEEKNHSLCFLDKKTVEKNLYFALKVKHNSVLLTASLGLNIRLLKQIQSGLSDQQLLDAFSKDILVGTLKHYDMLNSHYSQQFSIHLHFSQYLSISKSHQYYQCFNFYRFTLNSNGQLFMRYLFSVEYHQVGQSYNQYITKKVKAPRIQFKNGPYTTNVGGYAREAENMLKHHLIIKVSKSNNQSLYVQASFFKFDMNMQVQK